MDTGRLLDVAPHYVAMLILAYLVTALAGIAVDTVGFWVELALVFVVVFGYRRAVLWFGVGPDAWERR